jgi:small subunit ribosomal protein S8
MSAINDPIADFLTRIRNAYQTSKVEVSIPASNLKVRLAEILKAEGYIDDYARVPDKQQGLLVMQLRYDEDGKPVVRGIKRESRPGRRVYVNVDKMPRVRRGLGTAILSTSKGVMTDHQALKAKVGGEFICSVW